MAYLWVCCAALIVQNPIAVNTSKSFACKFGWEVSNYGILVFTLEKITMLQKKMGWKCLN